MEYLEYGGLKIFWTGHDGFRVEGQYIYYFDPYQLKTRVKADVIFISHNHFDHFSESDINLILKDGTLLVGPTELEDSFRRISENYVTLKPGEEYDSIDYGFKVKAYPSYNVNKFRAPGIPFHPKEDGKVGFLVEIGGIKLYHAGDSDNIPEYSELSNLNIDIAFIPVSGTYVMTWEEAVEAAKVIKPKIAIPMHYGSIVGSRADAERFMEALRDTGIKVVILEKG